MSKTTNTAILLAISAAILSACGGGGGGGGGGAQTPSPTATVTAAPTAAPTADPMQTADTAAAAAQAYLNAARNECGFGSISTNPQLASAALDANAYFFRRLAEGDTSYMHIQTVGKTGFTGIYPADRAAVRGYPNAMTAGGPGSSPRVAETLITLDMPLGYTLQYKNLAGKAMAQNLLNTVYHLGANMLPLADVGTHFIEANSPSGAKSFRLTFEQGDLTYVDTGKPGTDRPRTYPCEGSKVPARFIPNQEVPNPAPDVGGRVVGSPILIQVPPGVTPSILSYSVVNTRTGLSIPTRRIQNGCTNPPPGDLTACNQGESSFASTQAFLLPMDPLEVNVPHRVTYTLNGYPQAEFTFTPVSDLPVDLVKQ